MFTVKYSISKLFFIVGLFVVAASSSVTASPYFDRDGKTDLAVFRPNDRSWHTQSSETQTLSTRQWGMATDRLVPADYDGDNLTDYAVWRPESGYWYVLRSSDEKLFAMQWGMQNRINFGVVSDEPVVGDYDGDGIADLAVWRPTSGIWFVLKSSKNFDSADATVFQWGKLGDIPVPADYDGDRRTDFAVFRYTENRWYIFQSATASVKVSNLGAPGADLLVPADYSGDGKADVAVYRSGLWIVERSENQQIETYNLGSWNDTPVPNDYDGDGRTDFAVYRGGTWYVMRSSRPKVKVFNFGQADDVPLSSLNVKPSIIGVP